MDAFTTYHVAKIRQRELLDAARAAHDGAVARKARRAARRDARLRRETPARAPASGGAQIVELPARPTYDDAA
jgi:hypothetical protein